MREKTQVFIVRLWYEETESEDDTLIQSGSIEHVSTKKKTFFRDLDVILRFIDQVSGADRTRWGNRKVR